MCKAVHTWRAKFPCFGLNLEEAVEAAIHPPPPQTATITLTGSASVLNQFQLSHTATITVTVQ